jgi:hypothetical protein
MFHEGGRDDDPADESSMLSVPPIAAAAHALECSPKRWPSCLVVSPSPAATGADVRSPSRHRLVAIAALCVAAACSSREGARPSAGARDDRGLVTPSGPHRDAGRSGAPRHVLVVGGTGMLRPVSLELARRGYTTSVIARGRGPLDDMARESGGRIEPIALDYRDTDELVRALERSVAAHGPIVLVVAWIHAVAPDAPLVVARAAAAGGHRVDYFHVLGSAADDPSQPDPQRRAGFAAVAGLEYHEVILGFVREGSSSRWLTDDEIAAGVLDAIDRGAPRSIVGTTRPWSARP